MFLSSWTIRKYSFDTLFGGKSTLTSKRSSKMVWNSPYRPLALTFFCKNRIRIGSLAPRKARIRSHQQCLWAFYTNKMISLYIFQLKKLVTPKPGMVIVILLASEKKCYFWHTLLALSWATHSMLLILFQRW